MSEVEVVRTWHEALNSGDVDRLVSLCHADVEVGGPRGSSHGHEVLREWSARAGLALSFGKAFHKPGVVVVEEQAVWPGSPAATVASVFTLVDGLITRIWRYEGLAAALDAGGLSATDAVGV